MASGSQHHSLHADPRQYPPKEESILGPERLPYHRKTTRYICPAGQPLNYVGLNVSQSSLQLHRETPNVAARAPKPQCTRAASGASSFTRTNPPDNVRGSWSTRRSSPAAQRQRKKVEALFAELKNQIGLRRLRLRRLKFVREQFFLAAAAQNIKRLVRFLSQPTAPVLPATT